MPLFGAHMSVAGGLHKALLSAQELGCDTVQLFTASPSRWAVTAVKAKRGCPPWQGKPLGEEDVACFKRTMRACKLKLAAAHDSYLINLASAEEVLHRKSVEAFICELQKAEQLGLAFLVTHPGAHMGAGEAAGLACVVKAINEIHRRCPGYRVKILLEATAGQGSCLGHRFEHLAAIISRVREASRLGVCVDTCHIFAAGYDITAADKYAATMQEFDHIIGLKHLKLFHLNDSKKGLGSRVDRHEAIGRGQIGVDAFRLLVNDPRFQKLPMVLETPKESDGHPKMDEVNLNLLRSLLQRTTVAARPSGRKALVS